MVARRHHCVSKFYLGGFTDSGTVDGCVSVLDLESCNVWSDVPKNVGWERDFNRIDVEEAPADVIEVAIGKFEGVAAPVIRHMRAYPQVPTGRDFDLLMNLLALHSVRNPAFRKVYSPGIEAALKQMLLLATQTPERWKSQVARMRRDGVSIPDDFTWERMKRFAESDYRINLSNNIHVELMLHGVDTVLHLLDARRWTLLVAVSGAPSFVCSDRPVALRFTVPVQRPTPIGLGLPGTEVVFPISKRMALVGAFRTGPNVVASATAVTVGRVNAAIADYADRFIYSADAEFALVNPAGELVSSREMVVQRRRMQGSGVV